ncbi:hypothetical protein RDWZM_005557 [Blomia tropicalis]|uniref:Uncharacterized protein n=1 Tax=Blomia tropicalis TaxID=40697 RepID=A0A9Q0RMQ9_BLOTA|nr:hypothetical protein RDWZM_005557 [Blomia tropicalis]
MVKRLVVDRDLINTKFETYRYNRDCKYEIHSETIYNQQQIHSFKLNDTDYSYCHATMSSNLNCFYQDRNDPHRVYYITDSGSIIVASPTDPNNSCKFEQFQLFSIPAIEIKQFIDNPRASNEFPKYISFDNEGKDLLIVSSFKMEYKEVNIASIKESTNEIRIQPLIKKEEESSNSLATDSMCKERKETTEAKITKAVFDEYENFDFQDSEAFMVMVRFDCQSGSIHDEYDLSSQQWLFSMINYSKENRFPILVTRHDVDAFMYEPQIENGELRLKHLESFPAFGYVSVSKRNRRYMTFGPELDQMVINDGIMV